MQRLEIGEPTIQTPINAHVEALAVSTAINDDFALVRNKYEVVVYTIACVDCPCTEGYQSATQLRNGRQVEFLRRTAYR